MKKNPLSQPLAQEKEALACACKKKGTKSPEILRILISLYTHMEAAVEQIDKLVTQMTRLKASVTEVIKDIDMLKKRPGVTPEDLAKLDAVGAELSGETDKLVAADVPDENPPPTPEPPTT